MQKRTFCAALCLVLCFVLSGHASAAGSGIRVAVNGTQLETKVPGEIYNQVTYIHYWPVIQAMDSNATSVWSGGWATIRMEGLTLRFRPGDKYLQANNRCLYLPYGVRMNANGVCMIPASALAWALNGRAAWNAGKTVLEMTLSKRGVADGSTYYNSESVYLLSHIINAESGNQSLEGKIAVGNVILNRVKHRSFPNTIYGVIYQTNQFTPARTGAINRTPNAESIVAAKLCLEGANTAGSALYFINPRTAPNSWASRNRPYVATIGAHAFFA